MEKVNAAGFHSLLEERIADVLRGYGASVQPGPAGSEVDLLLTVPTTDGPRDLAVDVQATHAIGTYREGLTDVSAHEYVSPAMASSYRDRNRFYVDLLGNAYIVLPGFRVDVQGRRPPKTSEQRQLKPHRAFGAAGAKLVFALISRPEVIDWTVRDLAHLGGVSTGSVNNTIQDLERNGFLVPTASGRRLRRAERLAELWVSSYLTRILPKLEEASLTGPDPRWWPENVPDDAVLGGGVALAAMGLDIVPATALIYGRPPWGSVRKAGRLTREGAPTVVLREQFWDGRLNRTAVVAPPLLVYADAMASEDPRQMVAAADLWEKDADLRRLRALD